MEVGEEGDYNYTYRYSVITRMTSALRWAAAMRSMLVFHNYEGHNYKVTRQCPQTTTFEEKGEPQQIRTEVPLLTARPIRLAPCYSRVSIP